MSSESVEPGFESRYAGEPPRRRLVTAGIVGVVLVVAVVAAGLTVRASDSRKLKSWTDAQAVQTVSIVAPVKDAHGPTLTQVGGQAVLGRQNILPTPWLTERHG
ncbi:hypothetical protein QYH69_31475, partial [Paraburkholderia sp. SARCC-3016]|nr:hypothetical protein [Paraburkholderia sp. SARCC-3016]